MDFISTRLSRRKVLTSGAAMGIAALALRSGDAETPATEPRAGKVDPDGPAGPYPIPWLDKNGSHNQPAGPDLEPSHIYHFKGRVARCAGFNGVGTDQSGARLLFGARTTDYGIMDGEFWAARKAQTGAFTHI